MADMFPDTNDPVEEFKRVVATTENIVRKVRPQLKPLTWRWGKLFFLCQLVSAGLYCYFCYHVPLTGYAIAILATVAAVMSLREEPEIARNSVES